MKVEIDITNFMAEEEMKFQAQEGFRAAIERYVDRRYSAPEDLAYFVGKAYVNEYISQIIGKDFNQAVSDEVAKAIGNISEFSVFRAADTYTKAGAGYELLCQKVRENEDAIDQRIKEIITQIDLEQVGDLFYQMIENAIRENTLRIGGDDL